MRNRAYKLEEPEDMTSCVVFNSPHSGAEYPSYFLERSRLDPKAIRSSEDAYVDELFASAVQYGAPVLSARLPRAYVDLNRSEDELDPSLVAGAPKKGVNPRIAAGLGVIPRVVGDGKSISDRKISRYEADRRLRLGYRPYHRQLRQLIDAQNKRHGLVILFDCHSMPHEALAQAPSIARSHPDIILGDRFGAACERWITEATAEAFVAAGFTVVRNTPFAGGYITQHYGRPSHGVNAIQIEIDRSLYMDERTMLKTPEFNGVKRRLAGVISALAGLNRSSGAMPLAAE
ncbi:MAG: N-formylglutamate amidohydrolase [Paracoccaceae bacterium]